MSATTAGAVKATVEAAGLGLSAYMDGAPERAPLPQVVVQQGVAAPTEPHGDLGDPAADVRVAELVQVDLWQQARTPDPNRPGRTVNAEDPSLADRLHRALHGSRLPTAPTSVAGCVVIARTRTPARDNLVRTRYDLIVHRQLGA